MKVILFPWFDQMCGFWAIWQRGYSLQWDKGMTMKCQLSVSQIRAKAGMRSRWREVGSEKRQ